MCDCCGLCSCCCCCSCCGCNNCCGLLGETRWRQPPFPLKEGTTLAEIEIAHLNHAPLLSGMTPHGYTPLVLQPAGQGCVCQTRIPEGFFAMVTSCGKDEGVYNAGFYCFPPWRRVSYLVTKQLTVFDTPVKDCKTADNVTVNIDVSIVFEIVEPREFVYKLGPDKLDGMLRAAQDEALREMASSKTHDHVFELQGMETQDIVGGMNEKFGQYGVQIHFFTVKNVRLPPDLQLTMEKKTTFVSKEIEVKIKQELDLQQMNFRNQLEKIKEEAKVDRDNAQQEAETAKARMAQEVAAIRSTTAKETAKIEAEQQATVQQVASDSELEVARLQNERDSVAREVELELARERNEIRAEAWKYKREMALQTQLENAKNLAQADAIVAEAESQAAEALQARRKFQEDKAKLQVYQGLTENSSVRIASSAEVSARGLSLREDNVSQMVQSAVRFARAKFAEYGAAAEGGAGSSGLGKTLL